MLGEEVGDSSDVGEEDSGAEEEVEDLQEETEVQHKGVDHRPLDGGTAEVVRLEDGVAGKGEAEEEEGGNGPRCGQVQH